MPTPSPIDAFRSAHPTSTVRLGEHEWETIDARDASRTLLVLPGAIGLAESAWLTISSFTTLPEPVPLRVVAPSYPAEIEVMPDLVDGIAALLDALELDRVSVFGSSYGGFVAQMLARRHPQRVERLVLSHSVAADPARAARVYRSVGFLRFMREPWLKRNFRKQLQRSLDQAEDPLARLNADLMLDLAAQRVSGRAIANAYLRLATFDGLWDQQPNAPFAGPTLLLFGGLDPTTPPEEQLRLHEMYPQAQVRVFEDSGHNTAIDHHDAYFAALLEFLTASDAALPPPPAVLPPPPALLE